LSDALTFVVIALTFRKIQKRMNWL